MSKDIKLPPTNTSLIIGQQTYDVHDVPGDGSCLFHVINLAINGTTDNTAHVRRTICLTVLQNWQNSRNEVLANHRNVQNADEYYQNMVMGSGWGTVSEIQAATNVYNRNIIVWVQGQDANMMTTYFPMAVQHLPNSPTIEMLLSGNHYKLLIPRHDIITLIIDSSQNKRKQEAHNSNEGQPKRERNDDQNGRGYHDHTNHDHRYKKNKSSETQIQSKKKPARKEDHSYDKCKNQIDEPKDLPSKDTRDSDAVPSQQSENQTRQSGHSSPDLKLKCRKLGIKYEEANGQESMQEKKTRKRRNQAHILKRQKEIGINVTDLPNAPPPTGDDHFDYVLDCIRDFELDQLSYQASTCKVCNECRVQNKMAKVDICKRCYTEKGDADGVKMFSKENNMDPGPVPEELKDLTPVEQQLISRILPFMNIHMLKHGGQASSGHCVSFMQDVDQPARIFPRLPAEISFVRVRRMGKNDTSKDFRVRRYKVQNALQWLKANNPAYDDIEISSERLSMLPEDGECPDLATVECADDPISKDPGPAPDQTIDDGEVDTHSAVLIPSDKVKIRENINNAINDAISEKPKKKVVTLPWPTRESTPVPELTTVYFFTMAFPALFPHASADFFANRVRTCKNLAEWADHILWFKDGRFAHHPFFKFVTHNMIMRKRAMEQSTYIINQQLGDSHLSVADLKDRIQQGDNTIAQKILYFGAQLRGTPQFWGQKAKECRALTSYKINQGEGLPAYFATGSCAEFHFKPLRMLLEQYIEESTGEEIDLSNRTTLFKAVQENSHIVARYFDLRTTSFFERVMKPAFNVDTYWYRQEFAKNRGMVHWHGLCWRADGEPHNLLHQAIVEGLGQHETAEKLAKWAQKELQITACHPAGTDDEGHPRKDLWPPPEGNGIQPPEEKNPLLKLLMDASDSQASLLEDYLLMANRVNLHRCSDYCLRRPKSGKSSERTCRFEYGTEKQPGKPLRETADLTKDRNGHLRLEMPRDHPTLTQNSRFFTQAWRANCDISLILSKGNPKSPSVDDILAVEKYITGYACKGNEGTGALVDLFKETVQNTDVEDDGSSARSLVQKLLIRSVKRDVSAPEAVFELSSIPLVRSSHSFQSVSLTGARVLEKKGSTLTKSTPLDKYLSRRQDDKSSLYAYVCNSNKVPVVPGTSRAVMPLTEEYCRLMLLMHWPNWRKISDIKDEGMSWCAKFEEFLQTDMCPNFVKADVQRAKCGHTLQYDPENEAYMIDEEAEVADWMEIMRPQTEFEDSKFTYDDGGPFYKWDETSYNIPDTATSWIETVNDIANKKSDTLEIPDVDVNNLNDKQRFAFLLVMDTLRKHRTKSAAYEPLRMIVAGTAGSGKSYLIKCLVKAIRLLYGMNESVQVVCPTGNAAFVSGGVTLHRFFKVPMGKYRTEEMKAPDGKIGEILQENCANLQALLIDERSMVGANLLGWMEDRAKHGRVSEESWGGIPVVVLFGDDVQLPPVMDSPLYDCKSKVPASIHGVLVWNEFQTATTLTTIIRQAADQTQLRDTLMSLREYNLTSDQAKWLATFQWHELRKTHGTELLDRMYRDGLFVFPTHTDEWDHNKRKLLEANIEHPIAKCVAVSIGPHAKKSKSDDAGGLQNTIYLCKTAKVQLTANLCVKFGLYNGASGTIKDILYFDKRTPLDSLPDMVLVEFPGYSGPPLFDTEPKLIPIVPVERKVDCACRSCKRVNIPLRLGWASTIHRCQGLTVGAGETNRYIVINPGTTTFESKNPGALFVSLSRPKTVGGNGIDPDFAFSTMVNKDRFCHKVTTARSKARAKEISRIAQLTETTQEKMTEIMNDRVLDEFVNDILQTRN